MAKLIEQTMLALFPKRLFTFVLGSVSKSRFSKRLIPWYIRHYGIDVTEMHGQIHDYHTLTQFFSRKLKADMRPIANSLIVSPVDGITSEYGSIHDGTMIQAKGVSYTVAALLGSESDAKLFADGAYITLYLSPKDYHRIHMPCTGILQRFRHIPGDLYPVNASGVRSVRGLFAKNERVVTFAQTENGAPFAIVKVGAAGVGSVRTSYLPQYRWRHRARGPHHEGALSVYIPQGEEVGWFEFGSTVILVFSNELTLDFCVNKGNFVKMGAPLAKLQANHTERETGFDT